MKGVHSINELVKVNYESDRLAASAQEVHEFLNQCSTFEEFFITVSKMKVTANRDFLRNLSTEVKKFASKFSAEAVIYLSDSVLAESVMPCHKGDKSV